MFYIVFTLYSAKGFATESFPRQNQANEFNMRQTMKNAHCNRRKKGFTLIEILVVMAIIGILAGLLFPGVGAAMNAAKKAHASNTCYNLKNSIGSYFTEYRRFPLPDGYQTPYDDFSTEDDFMDILLGAETAVGEEKNPRGIVFFTGRTARRTGGNSYIKGVAMNRNGGGSLWDTYGRLYGVRMDTQNKSRFPNPEVDPPNLSGEGAPDWGQGATSSNTPPVVTDSVGVWSAGKEEDLSSDNIKTW